MVKIILFECGMIVGLVSLILVRCRIEDITLSLLIRANIEIFFEKLPGRLSYLREISGLYLKKLTALCVRGDEWVFSCLAALRRKTETNDSQPTDWLQQLLAKADAQECLNSSNRAERHRHRPFRPDPFRTYAHG